MLQEPRHQPYKFILTLIAVIALLIGAAFLLWKTLLTTPDPELTKPQTVGKTQSEQGIEEESTPNLPLQKLLAVPFTPQAPTANWDELHNEACEEASSIMAYAFFNNITSLPAATVEKEITKLTEWQQETFGYHLSITTEETAHMINAVYNLKTEIIPADEVAIKEALNENKLVILPANGRMLENPNFKAPGPIYHMLVITGYDTEGFITNDPGTRKGFNYRYTFDTLYAANGGWDHIGQAVNLTDKRIIIISV